MATIKICTVDECERPRVTHGYCRLHYGRWKSHGEMFDRDPEPLKHRQPPRCRVSECPIAPVTKGYCESHYYFFKTYGNPLYRTRRKADFGDKKRCARCHKIRELEHFSPTGKKNSGPGSLRQLQGYCKSCVREHQKEGRRALRKEVLQAYGNKCSCCGEAHHEFLSIDHIKGNGTQHRQQLRSQTSYGIYAFLKKAGFPQDEYRLLCMNCNHARGIWGYCPHERTATSPHSVGHAELREYLASSL